MTAIATWVTSCAVIVLGASAVRAAPAPVVLARCGDSSIEVTPGATGEAAVVHGVVVTGGSRWSFSANVGLVRIGMTTSTITVEEITTQDRQPARGKDAVPAALFIDLLIQDHKLLLRHASEGGADPDYTVDLDRCSFARDGDAALAALTPPPAEPLGCADATLGGYRTQVLRAAKLPEADAVREARSLCEDHQKTIAARSRLEAAISDRAARDRIAARGAAVLRTEDVHRKAWNRIDGCLAGEPARPHGVAALHAAEARTRACYARVAAKP